MLIPSVANRIPLITRLMGFRAAQQATTLELTFCPAFVTCCFGKAPCLICKIQNPKPPSPGYQQTFGSQLFFRPAIYSAMNHRLRPSYTYGK